MWLDDFEARLTPEQQESFHCLSSPWRIQTFLDAIPYSADPFNRCPLRVLQEQRANCFDGALLAALALRRLGHPPLLVNLYVEKGRDDEHLIAIYRCNGFWGALAKSNCVGIRFREPIYRSLRELVISYFEFYFSVLGEKTLRSYCRPLNLAPFDSAGWMWCDEGLEPVIRHLDGMRRIPLLTPEMVANLSPVDKRTLEAGFLGADPAGLFQPQR